MKSLLKYEKSKQSEAFEKLLANRVSQKSSSNLPILLTDLIELIQTSYQSETTGNSVASAGAIYGLNFEIVTATDQIIEDSGHRIMITKIADLSKLLLFDQLENPLAKVILIKAELVDYQQRYGNSGIRYALIEAGAFIQNFQLLAQTRGFYTCPLGCINEIPELNQGCSSEILCSLLIQ